MKKSILLLLVSLSLYIPRAQAVDSLPYLGSLRAQAFAQMTVASNNVAATNDVKGNKKLIKTLQGAVKLIDKTKPTYATGAKTLGVLTKTLQRTAVSNEFNGLLDSTLNRYVTDLDWEASGLLDRLNEAYSGKAHDAAATQLVKLIAAINAADTNVNLTLALKYLSTAAKSLASAQKAVDKAEDASAPPAGVMASVSGSTKFSYKSILAAAIAINSGNGIINSSSGLRGVVISLTGVNSGENTLPIGNHTSGHCSILVTEFHGTSFSSYESSSGTINVNYNPVTKSLSGTFTASCSDDDAKTISITGSFSAITL